MSDYVGDIEEGNLGHWRRKIKMSISEDEWG